MIDFAAARGSLQQRLAKILHIATSDDDAHAHAYLNDVLDQLIAIGDSTDDAMEYLSSFVAAAGDADENDGGVDLHLFSHDLKKFKLGEPICLESEETEFGASPPDAYETSQKSMPLAEQTSTAPAGARILDEFAAQKEEIKLREKEARERQRQEQEQQKKNKIEEDRRRRLEKATEKNKRPESHWSKKDDASINPRNASVAFSSSVSSKQPMQSNQTSSKGNKRQSPEKAVNKKAPTKSNNDAPTKPEKGTPEKICGCYGLKHNPLANCLHCGRISCEMEGYDYCPFCGYLIQQFIFDAIGKRQDSAMAHKERLLEYDRTSASRTQIHDDQEDYFVTSTSMWASQEEQENAMEMEEERRKKHVRGRQVLDINF